MSYLEQQAYAAKLCTEGMKRYKEGNIDEAIKLWKVSSDNKNCQARYCLALQHISGKYLEKDLKKAVSMLEEAANEGYEKAMFTLGDIFEKGSYGIVQDHDISVKYYTMYVKKGNPEAVAQVMKVAHKYEREMGISMINNAVAVKYYEIAADAGDLNAIMKTADINATGIGRMFDRQKAFKYYQIGAERGDIRAIESICEIYHKGLYDVPKNDSKFVELALKLAAMDPANKKYQKRIITLYENGVHGVKQDYDKVIEILQHLADLDVNEGFYLFRLGEIYEKGEYGKEADAKKAVEIYFDLINRYPENQDYQLKMAEIFEDGKYGVVQDKKKASLIYTNLVTRFPDEPIYQYKLGKMHYMNKDAESQKSAFQCFSHAYDLGSRSAGYYVVDLLFTGGAKFPKDYGRAIEIAQRICSKITDSYVLTREEQTLYHRMIIQQITMYAKGGPKLSKDVKKAKEILQEYNLKHEERIKVKF